MSKLYILTRSLNGSLLYYREGEWVDNKDRAEVLSETMAKVHKSIASDYLDESTLEIKEI